MITEGIFSRSRNPMYIGMFVFLIGISVCSMNLLSILSPFLFLFCIMLVFIPKEERMMRDEFGEEYVNYTNKVRRWL